MHTSIRRAACVVLALAAAPLWAHEAATCPAGLGPLAQCYRGSDMNGAKYWIAVPRQWNHMLVVHAHGGPRLSQATNDNNVEDLERFAVTVKQGFAWAGSTYRRPGYGVRMAAEDTENLRQIFIERFGKPERTILHGQSWGGNVAAKAVELYGGSYDGVVLTNGMLAGGTLNYLHRADLRAVYQYYCNNHPKPDEAQYPLWMGLPDNAQLKNKDLEARANECLGLKLPAAQRSAEQQRKLRNILAVVPVPERTLLSHLNWATFTFRDLIKRVGGKNPFDNRHVTYLGTDDDAALNRGVQRFDADPSALAQLADDSDLSGKLPVPVITLHAIDDPTALVEYEDVYRSKVAAAGQSGRLLQTFTREHDHSKLSDAEYAAVFNTLLQWTASGKKPSPADVDAACARAEAQFQGGCHFDLNYQPKALFERVPPRKPAN